MNASEVLCRLTKNQMKRVFDAARTIPVEKLDWKPSSESRSVLDQLQEVATAPKQFAELYETGRVDFSPERFARWVQDRSQYKSIEELERVADENTDYVLEMIRRTPESKLSEPVDLPMPGEWTYLDVLNYHLWNAAYHEGQIYYIGSMLESQG